MINTVSIFAYFKWFLSTIMKTYQCSIVRVDHASILPTGTR